MRRSPLEGTADDAECIKGKIGALRDLDRQPFDTVGLQHTKILIARSNGRCLGWGMCGHPLRYWGWSWYAGCDQLDPWDFESLGSNTLLLANI